MRAPGRPRLGSVGLISLDGHVRCGSPGARKLLDRYKILVQMGLCAGCCRLPILAAHQKLEYECSAMQTRQSAGLQQRDQCIRQLQCQRQLHFILINTVTGCCGCASVQYLRLMGMLRDVRRKKEGGVFLSSSESMPLLSAAHGPMALSVLSGPVSLLSDAHLCIQQPRQDKQHTPAGCIYMLHAFCPLIGGATAAKHDGMA